MARLISVNVGLPRDIEWKGRMVHTGIWKDPVAGPCRVGRLNLAGDGQGDLAGHGGEHRAVFVYQAESYQHWKEQLKRDDLVPGHFGENFTIDGLPDDEVCIGDRFQIGTAQFEVTQPRVTCYRVGIRLNEPPMAALLTGSNRPGFYFRVLQEGEVHAGDEIIKVGEGTVRMTVAQLNALLYAPPHPREQLERALQIGALSPGWRASFEALLQSETTGSASGNAGLAPAVAAHPAEPGFRPLTVTATKRESADVLSLTLQRSDGHPLPTALPGQYVVLRLPRAGGGAWFYRSYSLSGELSDERYRISVKLEPQGAAGTYLHEQIKAGDTIDVSSPRGTFVLQTDDRPIVLLSAGIGVTPVLAMLHSLAAAGSARPIWWIHSARDRQHHPFIDEVRGLLSAFPQIRRLICYSRPDSNDKLGVDFDVIGHLSQAVLEQAAVPREAEVYLCGPNRFMADMKELLAGMGLDAQKLHSEIFNGGESLTPGVVGAASRAPHPLKDDAGTGPLVSFARSGVAAHWDPALYQNILELAEACDVPVRWSCRTGVCHNCESGLVSGKITYEPEPLDQPAQGNLLICCSKPVEDLVVDL